MTSTPLIWEERQFGVFKTLAHGISFTVRDETLQIHVACTFLSQFYGCRADARRKAQEISDAIAGAIADAVSEERKLSDTMADTLKAIAKDAPTEEPEDNRGCGNEDDAYLSGADIEHYRLASLTEEALKLHAEARK